jgi:hypothetical protein
MKFRHYKGGEYELVTLAKDEETHEIMVVYRSDDGQVWSRPVRVFFSRPELGVYFDKAIGATRKIEQASRFVCVPPRGFEFCCDSGCEHVTPYPKLFEFSREEHEDGRVDSKTKPYWACHFCGEDVQLYETATGDVSELPENDDTPRGLEAAALTREDLAKLVEGMEVSVDVSTGDHDAGHRYFGTVSEAMDHAGSKHGVILLVQGDVTPNFDPSAVTVDIEKLKQASVQAGVPLVVGTVDLKGAPVSMGSAPPTDAVTREQVEAWARLAGIEHFTEKGLERLGDFAIFARGAKQ